MHSVGLLVAKEI